MKEVETAFFVCMACSSHFEAVNVREKAVVCKRCRTGKYVLREAHGLSKMCNKVKKG